MSVHSRKKLSEIVDDDANEVGDGAATLESWRERGPNNKSRPQIDARAKTKERLPEREMRSEYFIATSASDSPLPSSFDFPPHPPKSTTATTGFEGADGGCRFSWEAVAVARKNR